MFIAAKVPSTPLPRPLTRAAIALLALAGLAATPAAAVAAGPTGVVYVEGNEATGNSIYGFKRNGDGSLTALPGSPYFARGLGIAPSFDLGPYDSDQEIIATPDKKFVLAANGGSDTIAVFRVRDDGSLSHVDGSPFPSGGSNPVSLALSGDVLTVVNKDQDPGHPGFTPPNYTTMRIDGAGRLTPIRGSTFTVDLGAGPTTATLSPDGEIVFGCEFPGGGLLRSFKLEGSGRLRPVEAIGAPAGEFADTGAPPLPLGLWTHPTRRLLYVGFVTINRMGIYAYNKEGDFRFLRSVPNSGKGLCWLRSNAEGSRLYTSNTVDLSISTYNTAFDPAEPIEIQHLVLKGPGNLYQIGLEPGEKFFYAVSQRNAAALPGSSNALHVLMVNADGTLTEVASSPYVLPVTPDTRPQGILAF